jgi:hypothetical protein
MTAITASSSTPKMKSMVVPPSLGTGDRDAGRGTRDAGERVDFRV